MKISIRNPLALNETGQRENNEDSVFPKKNQATSDDRLFLVCDGVGGIEKGEIASSLVCNALAASIPGNVPSPVTEQFFLDAFYHAQEFIDRYITEHPDAHGMATTLTMLSLNDSGASIMWCGDSRVYHLRKGKIFFRTTDHSYVGELVRNGVITEEEAAVHPQKNVITRAMQGQTTKPVKPEIVHISDVKAGDQFFLCSDGILESLSSSALETILSENNTETAIEKIRELCMANSRDNYSCYLISIDNVSGSGHDIVKAVAENEGEGLIVEAHLIDEKPAKPNKTKKKFSLQDLGAGGKILLVILLVGIIFSIWFFGLHKPAESKVVADSDSLAVVTPKGPSAGDLVARVENIISYTEENMTGDSLDAAREILHDTIIPAGTAKNLILQIQDLEQLCEMLSEVQADTSEKKGPELKKYKSRIDKIIDFVPESEGLYIENFISQAEELKNKLK